MPIDHRFYKPKLALDLNAVAKLTGAELRGTGNKQISGLASSANAGQDEVCFFEGRPKDAANVSHEAAACFVNAAAAEFLPQAVAALIVDFPRYSHALVGNALYEYPKWPEGDFIFESAAVSPDAIIGPGVAVGPGAAIGPGTNIGPHTAIGPGVQIGRNCNIGANASIQCTLIGDRVNILSGARIGEAGFGVLESPEGISDVPQYGRVIIQDDVTIGANTCIDRGAFEDTVIGERSKIDNQCQIAHNVTLGRGVIIAAFGGISGSVTIEDGAMLGGRVGVADHVHVGKNAKLAASAGVFRDIPAGETWGGTPAIPVRQWMRERAMLQKQIAPKKKT